MKPPIVYKILHIPTGEFYGSSFRYSDRAESYIRFLVCMRDNTDLYVTKEEFEVVRISDDLHNSTRSVRQLL